VVHEVWIAPRGHPGIAVVVGVVVVYRVLGTIPETEVNLGHLERRFVREKIVQRRELTTAIPDVWMKAPWSLPPPGT